MQKIPITKAGYEALQVELKNLKEVERPKVIIAIAEAREHGDLKENAEYHSARDKQSFIEGRAAELEAIVSLAEVIDVSLNVGSTTVKFGATVVIADCDTEAEKTYTIVGDPEANVNTGRISLSSPVSRAMIGKEAGDVFIVLAPSGDKEYEIIDIKYNI